MAAPQIISYVLLLLAAITAVFPLVSDIVRGDKPKKLLHFATILLITIAAAVSVFDQRNKDEDARRNNEKQLKLVKAADTTVEKLGYMLHAISKIKAGLDSTLLVQRDIMSNEKNIGSLSKRIDTQERSLLNESDRALSPLCPMLITVYYEVPMDQFALFPLNAMAHSEKDRLARFEAEIQQTAVAKLSNGSKMIYPNPYSPPIDSNHFSIYPDYFRHPQSLTHGSFTPFLENQIRIIVDKGRMSRSMHNDSLVPETSAVFGTSNTQAWFQVDIPRKMYLVTVRYLVNRFSNKTFDPKAFGFHDLLNCEFWFTNKNFYYTLRAITLKSLNGLSLNHICLKFSKFNSWHGHDLQSVDMNGQPIGFIQIPPQYSRKITADDFRQTDIPSPFNSGETHLAFDDF